jgi:hypothetical protein
MTWLTATEVIEQTTNFRVKGGERANVERETTIQET